MARIRRKSLALLFAALASASVWAIGSRPCVRIQGRFATDDVVLSGGKVYVPVPLLADVLRLKVRESADGCDLVGSAGGASDLGQPMVRDGFRLEVIDAARATGYRARYGYYDFPVSAHPGNELFIVTCRVFNGTGAAQSIHLTNGRDTLLADARFRSYRCLRGNGGGVLGGMLSMLPNGEADFALKFEVPAGFRPERLVVSLQTAFDREPTDFRVSLSNR